MIPETLELDLSLVENPHPLTLYRLAKFEYATLSGVGAAVRPGRWNSLGTEAIYTSLDAGVTILERLVHTDKAVVPRNLVMLTISLSGEWSRVSEDLVQDHTTGARMAILSTLKSARNYLPSRFALPFAMTVPSVIAPSWNVVLFPKRTGFEQHVHLVKSEPFEIDLRLFPENARLEA